jgi:hypothetical protein
VQQVLRGEELNFFSDAGAVNTTRSPAGEATAPIRSSDMPRPGHATARAEEVFAGIQGASLLHERVSSQSASGRLT